MNKYLLLLIALCLIACQPKKKTFEKLETCQWLKGSWEVKRGEGILQEIWKQENDSTYSGESYYIKNLDTIHIERMELFETNERLYYTTTVVGQNSGNTITLSEDIIEEGKLQFKNIQNSFPKSVTYLKIKDNQIVFKSSGTDGKKKIMENYSLFKK